MVAGEIAFVLATALIGITFISGALQGHVSYVGGLGDGPVGIIMRVILFAAGLLFAAPGNETLGVTHTQLSLAGIVAALPPLIYAWTRHREA